MKRRTVFVISMIILVFVLTGCGSLGKTEVNPVDSVKDYLSMSREQIQGEFGNITSTDYNDQVERVYISGVEGALIFTYNDDNEVIDVFWNALIGKKTAEEVDNSFGLLEESFCSIYGDSAEQLEWKDNKSAKWASSEGVSFTLAIHNVTTNDEKGQAIPGISLSLDCTSLKRINEYIEAAGNPDAAAKAFMLAAQQGSADAWLYIGRLYEQSGMLKEAAEAYYMAAGYGEVDAMVKAGTIYSEGAEEEELRAGLQLLLEAAEQGDTSVYAQIGSMYFRGIGTAQDYDEAFMWFQRAIEQQDYSAALSVGIIYDYGYIDDPDYKLAMEWYLKAAEDGDPEAMVYVATGYLQGIGVEQDQQAALEWFQKAADLGNTNAMIGIGRVYEYGRGVEQNFEEALTWYEKAADQGNTDAMCILGAIYFDCDYMVNWNQDVSLSLEWYKKAMDAGNLDAMAYVGYYYLNGLGVDVDYDEGMRLLGESIDNGSCTGYLLMGKSYWGNGNDRDFIQSMDWFYAVEDLPLQITIAENAFLPYGIRPPKGESLFYIARDYNSDAVPYAFRTNIVNDPNKALDYYQRALEQGFAKACGEIGYMYEGGYGIEANVAKAMEWYQKGIDLGDADCMYCMGYNFFFGDCGFPLDRELGLSFIEKAALNGVPNAMVTLGSLYLEGKWGVKKDISGGQLWIARGGNSGNADAAYMMGNTYYYGLGVFPDYEIAFNWYKKAADYGHAGAMDMLATMYEKGQGVIQDFTLAQEWRAKARDARQG